MSCNSNLEEVLAALKVSKEQALELIGTTCEADTKLICPVGSDAKEPRDPHKGNMRSSITHKVVSDNEVDVGVTHEADYSVYVDQGSSKQPAQHFLENGVQQGISQCKSLVEGIYSANMGR